MYSYRQIDTHKDRQICRQRDRYTYRKQIEILINVDKDRKVERQIEIKIDAQIDVLMQTIERQMGIYIYAYMFRNIDG